MSSPHQTALMKVSTTSKVIYTFENLLSRDILIYRLYQKSTRSSLSQLQQSPLHGYIFITSQNRHFFRAHVIPSTKRCACAVRTTHVAFNGD